MEAQHEVCNTLRLDDLVIARIAQVLQEALLTGTDITDMLRSIELSVHGDKVVLAAGYVELVADHHKRMLESLAAMGAQRGAITHHAAGHVRCAGQLHAAAA